MRKTEERILIIVWMPGNNVALVEDVGNVPGKIKKGNFLNKDLVLLLEGEGVKIFENKNEEAEKLFCDFVKNNSFVPKKFFKGVIFSVLEPIDEIVSIMKSLGIKTERELIEKTVNTFVKEAISQGHLGFEKTKTWRKGCWQIKYIPKSKVD